MWILSCAKLINTCSKLTNSFLVTVAALSTAKTTNSEKDIYFLTLMSCSINKVLHVIHMWKFCFSILCGKIFFAPRNDGEGGGLTPPCPPSFSLALYYEHIMNIYYSSKFTLRIRSVLSSFLHAIWTTLSLLFKSLKQWNNLVGI